MHCSTNPKLHQGNKGLYGAFTSGRTAWLGGQIQNDKPPFSVPCALSDYLDGQILPFGD